MHPVAEGANLRIAHYMAAGSHRASYSSDLRERLKAVPLPHFRMVVSKKWMELPARSAKTQSAFV